MDDLHAFDDYIESLGYAGAYVSSVAFGDGREVGNIVTRVTLAPIAPAPEEWSQLNASFGSIRVCREWLDGFRHGSITEMLERGRIALPHFDLILRGEVARPYTWRWHPDGTAGTKDIGWFAPKLVGSGARQRDIAVHGALEQLIRDLPTLSDGRIGNLAHLQRLLCPRELPLGIAPEDLSHLEVYAPRYIRITDIVLDRAAGQVTATIDCTSQRDANIAAFYLFHERMTQPQRFTSTDLIATKEPTRFTLISSVPQYAGVFDLTLAVAGQSIQVRRFGLPTLAAELHAILDPDWRWLGGMLSETRGHRESNAFEHYVLSVVQLCGIPAVHYGFRSEDNFPDLVGSLDDATFLVGECKVISPTTEAIETLHDLAQSIEQGLWERRQLNVLPIFFTALTHAEVNPLAVARAHELNVTIVSRETLRICQRLLERGEARTVLQRCLLRTFDDAHT